MDRVTRQRLVLAGLGAAAGASLYLLSEVIARELLSERLALALTTFAAAFFTAVLAMTGPLRLRSAAMAALAVATLVAALLTWSSLRFAAVPDLFERPAPVLAAALLGVLPLPFVIAAHGPGWRDYPALFGASWTIVVRFAAASLFVGVVWALILLSDKVLGIVGVTLIQDLLKLDAVPWVVSGLTLGLALAVVTEMAGLVSPYLILRLLRLLLPAVLVVMAVFIAALPFRGLSGLFGELSAAATLLAMALVAATLVTTAIDQSDAEASQSPLMRRAAQCLALILPVPSGLALYAVWLRVAQYGWTPDRVVAALLAVLALGYGLAYAASVLRGAGWMARIRAANIALALVLAAMAVMLLTPALNPERMAAASQITRFADGRTPASALDPAAFQHWGIAGRAALADLRALAQQPGQETLAQALAEAGPKLPEADRAQRLAALRGVLPVQPPGSDAARDALLAALTADDLAGWLADCRALLPGGGPGCVMVLGDFWPSIPGDEAISLLRGPEGYLRYEGLAIIDGKAQLVQVRSNFGQWPEVLDGPAAIRQLQANPPQITPMPANQLQLGKIGLVLLP